MVPEEKYPQQAAQLSVAIAFGSLVGPLIGGGASQNSQWRWVFLFKYVLFSCHITQLIDRS